MHGHQLGRFFHGYHERFCDLPLHVVCGDHPLLALLRPADLDASAGTVKYLARIVARIREACPEVEIVFRGDSDFQREPSMAWCEANREFAELSYRTQKTWSRERRVIGRAEHLAKGSNPRYVVTSYDAERFDARTLYEVEDCGRGGRG